MTRLLLRLFRLSLYLGLTLLMMPFQAAALAFLPGLSRRIPRTYHRLVARILGIEIEIRGTPSSHRPTLFVANHISYLDIEVLSATVPGSFIAKAEIRRWPFFGWLARLQRTVFIERRARTLADQRDSISRRLLARDNLILFPEGTSGDGNRVLPFKSALFSISEVVVDGRQIAIQPVSLAYTRLNGIPIGRDYRPHVAWYGDMSLVPHLWQMVGMGKLLAAIEFHGPVQLAEFASRKALADYCQRIVAGGVSAANAGRLTTAAVSPADGAPFR